MITKKDFCAKQDHSCLGWVCPRETVRKFCNETLAFGFASLVVNPDQVAYCRSVMEGRAGIGAVIGFPQGMNTTNIKIAEGLEAIENGATDLDVVTNFSLLFDGRDGLLLGEYRAFVNSMRDKKPDVVIKIIVYQPYGQNPSLNAGQTRRVSECVAESGADFIKICCDLEAVQTVVAGRVQIKHSGCAGLPEALEAIEKGCTRIGHEFAPIWLREAPEDFWGRSPAE